MCVCVLEENLSYYFERKILHIFIPQNAFPSFFSAFICSSVDSSPTVLAPFSSCCCSADWDSMYKMEIGIWLLSFCVYIESFRFETFIFPVFRFEYNGICVYAERMNDGNILLSRSVFTLYADADVFMRRRKCLGGGWLVNCDRSFLFTLQAVNNSRSSSSRRAVANDCLDEWCSSRHLSAEWAFFLFGLFSFHFCAFPIYFFNSSANRIPFHPVYATISNMN